MTKDYLEAAIEIAQEAGKILVEELSRPLDIRYKGDEVDIVTQADKRSEQAIVARLNKYFPDHSVAAEDHRVDNGIQVGAELGEESIGAGKRRHR